MLCISVLLVAIDNTIVVTAYSLLFAGLLLVAGHLGDRMGRKRYCRSGWCSSR